MNLSFQLRTSSLTNLHLIYSNIQNNIGDRKYEIVSDATTSTSVEIQSGNIIKKRRQRYSGKYPRKFEEKYKEERGDKDIIEKVTSKGGTPAGTHIPIMLNECLESMHLLNTNASNIAMPNSTICFDCTLGYGGHSMEILKRILPIKGQLYAIDQDINEIVKTETRIRSFLNDKISNTDRLQHAQSSIYFTHGNFKDIISIAQQHNIMGKVTSLIADLGFSSMQIDNPDRGFTYKFDGPLDMRMDQTKTITAAEYLQTVDEEELSAVLRENSDEIHADTIAKEIKTDPIPQTTLQLADRVRQAYTLILSKHDSQYKRDMNSAIARTMQAIRIAVNEEFSALDALLEALPYVLAPNGRVATLTFHSGEDRRVKKSFKTGVSTGVYSSWSRDVVRASFEEQNMNPRSKCAKLRWAVRSDVHLDQDISITAHKLLRSTFKVCLFMKRKSKLHLNHTYSKKPVLLHTDPNENTKQGLNHTKLNMQSTQDEVFSDKVRPNWHMWVNSQFYKALNVCPHIDTIDNSYDLPQVIQGQCSRHSVCARQAPVLVQNHDNIRVKGILGGERSDELHSTSLWSTRHLFSWLVPLIESSKESRCREYMKHNHYLSKITRIRPPHTREDLPIATCYIMVAGY
eukprot:gene8979-18582_t